MHRLLAAAALLVLAAAPVAAASADATRACADAARAMIAANEEIRTAGAYDTESRIAAGETISWESVSGHAGVCRLDAQGRLFAIEITRFPAGWGGGFTPYTLTCDSDDGRRQECAIESPSVVTLSRQYSRAECVEGSTWGYGGGVLWVADGCRGSFLVSPAPSWAPYTVTCESASDRRRDCEIRPGATVRLARQLSRSRCIEGTTWGAYGTTLWVDDGCRGVFEVSPGGGTAVPVDHEARAREACQRQAVVDGLVLLRVQRSEIVGRYVELTVDLDRRGIAFQATCRYDTVSGNATIIGR